MVCNFLSVGSTTPKFRTHFYETIVYRLIKEKSNVPVLCNQSFKYFSEPLHYYSGTGRSNISLHKVDRASFCIVIYLVQLLQASPENGIYPKYILQSTGRRPEYNARLYLRGREPILFDPSQSCTQKDVISLPSHDLMTHTLWPVAASRIYSLSVSGNTFCTNIC